MCALQAEALLVLHSVGTGLAGRLSASAAYLIWRQPLLDALTQLEHMHRAAAKQLLHAQLHGCKQQHVSCIDIWM